MTAETWTLFLAVAAAAVLSPGPAMLAILGQALQRGGLATVPVVAGNALGVVALMAASVLGLAALPAAVPHGLTALRWIGAGYLAWLGLKALWAPADVAAARDGTPATGMGLGRGVLIALSNPKAILFFGAVLPQFVDPARPTLPQFAGLAATFAGLELLATGAVALAAHALAPMLRRPATALWINRAGGVVMLAAALLLVLSPSAEVGP
ncbi:LysE family translocator [Pseudoroseomonas sp. WGS1072]|uniref:LysE family translocator n=1 Tax=Roseomonas sp. WGS1072 TaxID=3366816 RepID=UPI003BF15ABE